MLLAQHIILHDFINQIYILQCLVYPILKIPRILQIFDFLKMFSFILHQLEADVSITEIMHSKNGNKLS